MKFSFFFDSIERDDRRGSMMDYRGSHGWMLYYYSSFKVINAINVMMILS